MEDNFRFESVNGLAKALGGRIDLLEKIFGKKVRDNLKYSDIQKIVKSGFASEFFELGDEIMTKYTATDGTVYDFPWRIVDFRDVYWENDPTPHPGMVLQSKYATVEKISPSFSVQRHKVDLSETEAQERWYYYGRGTYAWDVRYLKLNPGDPIPHSDYKAIYKTLIQYGDPNGLVDYVYTNARQWLNSDKQKGEWWIANFEEEIEPTTADTYNGFMYGLTQAFLNVINPVRLLTNHYFTTDGTYLPQPSVIYSYERFYIPSAIEMYILDEDNERSFYPNTNPGEDKVFEYYKTEGEKEGHYTAHVQPSQSRVFCAVDNTTVPINLKTRTTCSGWPANSLDIFSNGQSGVFNPASEAKNQIPCCVIS